MPRIPRILESYQQDLYDQANIQITVIPVPFSTVPCSQVTFFQVPIGGLIAGTTSSKTELQTNMDQGGSLPYPKNFELHAIRLIPEFGASIHNLNLIYNEGWFRFFVGTKDYLVVNAFMLTAGVHLDGVLAGNTNTVSVANGRADQRGTYVLAEPIDLIPQQNFSAAIYFPSPIVPTTRVQMSCYLAGLLKREVH